MLTLVVGIEGTVWGQGRERVGGRGGNGLRGRGGNGLGGGGWGMEDGGNGLGDGGWGFLSACTTEETTKAFLKGPIFHKLIEDKLRNTDFR